MKGAGAGGANLLAVRSHNTALVLDLLRAAGAGGVSRLELAERTGLTPQAVSKITARLREEGLAAEAGHRASTGGKPRTLLRLVPEAGHAVGVHLDRDGVRTVLADLSGTVVADRWAPVDFAAGVEAVVEAVVREVTAGVTGSVRGVGPPDPADPTDPATETRGVSDPGSPGDLRSPGGADSGSGAAPSPGGADSGSRAALSPCGADSPPGAAPSRGSAHPGSGAAPSPDGVAPAAPGPRFPPSATPTGATARALGESGFPGPDASTGTPAPTPAGPVLPVLGVGVALPGPLDHPRGVLHRVTGFPEWDGFPLRDVLARRLGVPVTVDKDTNAAALGLALGGAAGAGEPSFAYLYFGTGLGAGLVLGGVVHRGARTGAGEFGHQVVQRDGPPCDCGDRGCVEALCLAAVARGDLAEAGRVLGVGAGNLVALLDVDLVLLGGRTVTEAPEPFLRGVTAVLDARARRTGEPPPRVRVAEGGVAEGAAQLVLAPVFGRAAD
ncbi:ROK family protein [Streptomyces sp. ACT015]|uniref:ROK family protein n=1 Tax=Streptomyces sp. ACT015 TaxID=3134807 RepID=UPI003D165B65